MDNSYVAHIQFVEGDESRILPIDNRPQEIKIPDNKKTKVNSKDTNQVVAKVWPPPSRQTP